MRKTASQSNLSTATKITKQKKFQLTNGYVIKPSYTKENDTRLHTIDTFESSSVQRTSRSRERPSYIIDHQNMRSLTPEAILERSECTEALREIQLNSKRERENNLRKSALDSSTFLVYQ